MRVECTELPNGDLLVDMEARHVRCALIAKATDRHHAEVIKGTVRALLYSAFCVGFDAGRLCEKGDSHA